MKEREADRRVVPYLQPATPPAVRVMELDVSAKSIPYDPTFYGHATTNCAPVNEQKPVDRGYHRELLSTGAFAVFSIGPTIAGATITGRTQLAAVDYGTIADDGNSGTAKTIDFSAKNIRKVRLTGSCTFTFTPPAGATTILLKLTADGTGAYTSTWPGTIVWNGGSAPDNLTANEVQWIGGTYDGTNYYLDFSPSSATVSKVSVTDESSDTICFPGFVTAATGAQALHTNASYTFNSATGKLSATKLGGTISNNETAATMLGRRGGSAGDTEEVTLGGFSEMSTAAAFKPRGPLTNTTANGATTIALATSNRHVLTLTASATLTLTGDNDGDSFVLWVRGQASGFTLTFWSGVKWVGGSAPTIPTSSGRVMTITFTRLASGEYIGAPVPEAF